MYPATSGWLDGWNAGMPWPIGYPPLFYFIFGFLLNSLNISPLILFKYIFILLYNIFPLLGFVLAKRFKLSNFEALFAGILVIFFLILPNTILEPYGITMRSTFESGLYPHFFGSVLFLLWLTFYIGMEKSLLKFYISTLLLSLTLLSNIHVGEAAFITIFCFSVVHILIDRSYKYLFKSFLQLVVSILLISFWSFPLLETLGYFPSKTFSPINMTSVITTAGIFVVNTFGLMYVYKYDKTNHNLISIYLSAFALCIFSLFPTNEIFPGLPIHPGRLFSFGLFLEIFILIFFVKGIVINLNLNKAYLYILCIILLLPFLDNIKKFSIDEARFTYTSSELKLISDISELKEGRSTFEVIYPGYPQFANLSALSAIEKHNTLWNVFRESSISSFFTAPVRNLFSYNQESYGIDCFLCNDSEFNDSSIEDRIKVAELYNLKYFVVATDKLKKELLKNNEFELISSYRNLYLFKLNTDSTYTRVLDREPILTITELKSKKRDYSGENAYDWIRFSEIWLNKGLLDIPLVFQDSRSAEIKTTLKDFKIILIEEISDREKMKNEIINNYNNNLLIFLINDREVKVAEEIKNKVGKENVEVIIKSGDVKRDIESVLDMINNKNIKSSSFDSIENYKMNNKSISFNFSDKKEKERFIYLKSSYFPFWKINGNGKLYMVSPSLTLIKTNEENIQLEFLEGQTSKVGKFLSFATFFLFPIFIIYLKKRPLMMLSNRTIK